MASDVDIRTMLIDALRPSLLEFVRQEIDQINDLGAALARVETTAAEAAFQRKMLPAREDEDRDWSRIEDRLAGIEAQLAWMKQDLDSRNRDLMRLVDRLVDVIDRVERRLTAAGAALRRELRQLPSLDPGVFDEPGDGGRLRRERSFG